MERLRHSSVMECSPDVSCLAATYFRFATDRGTNDIEQEQSMQIRIVTFTLDGMTADQYESHAAAMAKAFTHWPGLRAKFWLADRAAGVYGGVYVFDSKASADLSRTTGLYTGLVDSPGIADLDIREFETLSEPTQTTGRIEAAALSDR